MIKIFDGYKMLFNLSMNSCKSRLWYRLPRLGNLIYRSLVIRLPRFVYRFTVARETPSISATCHLVNPLTGDCITSVIRMYNFALRMQPPRLAGLSVCVCR